MELSIATGLVSLSHLCYRRVMSDNEVDDLHLPSVFPQKEELTEVQEWYDPTRLERVRRKSARSANAIHDTFDLIGGVPRLAAWANDNEGAFYTKLFSKTVERAGKVEHSGEIRIVSSIPRTVLDGEFTEVPDD